MNADATLIPLIDAMQGHGERPAILAFTAGGVQTRSYAGLSEQVRRLAQGMVDAGVPPGAAVALFAPDRPEWIAAALATIRAKAVVMPLDAQLGDEVLAHVLHDSGARLIFTSRDRMERVARLAPTARLVLLDADPADPQGWQRLLAASPASLPQAQPQDPAALFYTSGTTGLPKGVPLSHANLAFQVEILRASGLLAAADRVALPLPLHHVYPFVLGMLTPLALGLPLILPQTLTGPQVLRALKEGEATVMVGVPRLYQAMLAGIEARVAAHGRLAAWLLHSLLAASLFLRRRLNLHIGRALFGRLHRELAPRLRLLACGGAALDADAAARLEGLGWQIAIGYGLTETSPLLTFKLPGSPRPDSAGKPVAGVELRIDALTGTAGEIQARGPNVFAGYLNLPDKTREAFTADGWFRTGDLGFIDKEGYLHITGRAKEILVTAGGENVQPEAVESAYQRHPFIREFALLQHDGNLVGLILPEAAAIRRAGFTDVAAAVRQAVAEIGPTLPSYQRIDDYALTLDPLPRTRLGKLKRHLLSEAYRQARTAAGETRPLPPESWADADRLLLESAAARAGWQTLATRHVRRRLTPDTSLRLDLGVDSLGWLELALEIEQKCGVELTEGAIDRIETVRDLLRELGQAPSAAAGLDWAEPEQALSPQQWRWLTPLVPAAGALFTLLYGLGWLVMRLAFRLRVEGLEHLPATGQWVFVPNHASALDPFALAAALGRRRLTRTWWAGWTGIAFANLPLRLLSRLGRALPVDPEHAPISSLALAAGVLKQGGSLVWFAEGRRSPSGELQPFRPGIGLLLARFPVTAVPVHITGGHEALPPGKRLPRLAPIRVRFGLPLDTRALAAEKSGEEAAARITQALHARVAALSHPDEAESPKTCP